MENQHARKRMHTLARSRVPHSQYAGTRSSAARSSATHASARRHRYYERFHNQFVSLRYYEGDVTAARTGRWQAAIDALGNMNGTVVAIEPTSGRILAIVNQRLALSAARNPARRSAFCGARGA